MPEVAFAGRSNVGKSSVINQLLRRRAFARVSNTPGRTREINFFRVNDAFVLADLPGYGYARISKERHQAWQPLIESYLAASPMLRGVVQLLDVRREPSDQDRQMLAFLEEHQTPVMLVLTKIDKLNRSAVPARLGEIAAGIGIETEQIIPFSAVTGEGRDDLAASIMALMSVVGGDTETTAG